jgi:hypothetical protein
LEHRDSALRRVVRPLFLSVINSIVGLPMSLVARQLAFDAESFDKRYTCSWLVWEVSGWTPPLASADQSVVATRHDTTSTQPVNGDPLCFPLRRGELLRIGRASENEIVISDATVSRTHAVLSRSGDVWVLRAAPEGGLTRVFDERVAPGRDVALATGDVLQLGGAQLSFLDLAAFRARTSAVMPRAAAR